ETVRDALGQFNQQQAGMSVTHQAYLDKQSGLLNQLYATIQTLTAQPEEVVAPIQNTPAPRPVVAPPPKPVGTGYIPSVQTPPTPKPVVAQTPPPAPKPVAAPPPMAKIPVKSVLPPASTPKPVAPVVTTPAPTPVVASTPAPTPVVAGGLDLAKLSSAMMVIVSKKTGYPLDILDLSMDMEADLGIDSIKRVEILGAMRNEFPDLPQLKPDELGQLRTLGEIVDYMAQSVGVSTTSTPANDVRAQHVAPLQTNGTYAPAPTPVVASTPAPTPVVAGGLDLSKLSTVMMAIVSKKTGYPLDILDLSMDMEADLGIDSIKRVEILGAMRNEFPDLPQLKPDELGQLRTLGEIVDYMAQSVGGAPATTNGNGNHAPEPVGTGYIPSVQTPPTTGGLDLSKLSAVMMAIVSKKTGYPLDILDLSMDMEADLGIDSIKRVEILGAMRTEFPDLPQLKPDELGQLRTLGEIVDYMAQSVTTNGGTTSPKAFSASVAESNGAHPADEMDDMGGIGRMVARSKWLPAPDMREWSLPEGTICLILADGTPRTIQLADALKARGIKVAITGAREAVMMGGKSPSHPHAVIPDSDEASLMSAIDHIKNPHGQIGAFIALAPTFTGLDDSQRAFVKQVFLTAKHLKNSLTTVSNGAGVFMTVAQLDGSFGMAHGANDNALVGGLTGLVKTLKAEWGESVFCRALDLAPTMDTTSMVNAILAELYDPKRALLEVGYGESGRMTVVGE
ncbi:MAG: phosphopantetheine-binding protein, partial [bacterium]|nr:phosphopantetheine-binding protein [bacterium]